MPPARLRASKLGSPKPTGSPPPGALPTVNFAAGVPSSCPPVPSLGRGCGRSLSCALPSVQRCHSPCQGDFFPSIDGSDEEVFGAGGTAAPRGGHLLSFWGAGMLWHPPAGSARGFGGATRKRGNQSISRREAGVSPASPSISSAPLPVRYLDCKIKLF